LIRAHPSADPHRIGVVSEGVTEGDGYAVGHIDQMGDPYGFRKVRRELGVSAFGVNAIVLPAGYETGRHFHDQQEELYFCHRGRLEIEFGDGTAHTLEPGTAARVDAATVRQMRNVGEEDAVYLVIGGKDGYVGRDGRLPADEESPRGAGFSGPPGAGPPLPGESGDN
jgi:mannose-6-phosphate isomerase-like protein (cupin superfamily)